MHDSLVKLRRPRDSDISSIEDLAAQCDFPLVQRFDSAAVVESGSELIAFGVTRQILEVIIYCDGRDRDKALAMSKLIDQAKMDAKSRGFDDIYAFIQNESVVKSMLKHHKFRIARGTPVILDLEP